MSQSDLWEIVLPDKLQVGDVIAKHCSETPQEIVTIERARPPVFGFSGAFIVNDNQNRPLLDWMPIYRRYTGPSPEVLRRALEMACSEIEARDRYGTTPNPKADDFVKEAIQEIKSEGDDGIS